MIIPAVKLQATAQTRLFTAFHQLETMHEKYRIFSFSASCYASLMQQNVNPVTLISKNDTPRIVKTLLVKTLKLYSQNLGIFRVTVLSSKWFSKNIAT